MGIIPSILDQTRVGRIVHPFFHPIKIYTIFTWIIKDRLWDGMNICSEMYNVLTLVWKKLTILASTTVVLVTLRRKNAYTPAFIY